MIDLLDFVTFKMGNASPYDGLTGFNIVQGTKASYGWTSFAEIGLALIIAGFCIRCIALMRLAVTGRGNVMEVAMKLSASIIAIVILRILI